MWTKDEPRQRLRAPDEAEGDARLATATDGGGGAGLHGGFRSPEYIEERLENLKRRPAWGAFLDEYVDAHADDDHDEADPETRRHYALKDRRRLAQLTRNPSGFLASMAWSLLAVAFSPLLLLLYPLLRRKGLGFWPMRCSGVGHLLQRSAFNLLAVVYGLLLLYWAICHDLPELNVDNVVTRLDVRLAHLLDSGHTCQSGLTEFDISLARELCTGVAVDALFVSATVWLIFQSHQRWGRYAMVAMTIAFFLDAPAHLHDATYPSPSIGRVDPSYAMIDEEITIALEGQNLKPGGSVAWVSYWGCATTAEIATCEKQFASVFDMGVAHVTFKTIDHFIPCYRNPPNPLKAQEFVCFPSVRVRVKDKQSIPGWSKIQQPVVHTSAKETASSAPVPSDASTASDRKESDSFTDTGDYEPELGIEEPEPDENGALLKAASKLIRVVTRSIVAPMTDPVELVDDASDSDDVLSGDINIDEMLKVEEDQSRDLLETEEIEEEVELVSTPERSQHVVEVEFIVRGDSTSIDQGEVVSGKHSDVFNETTVSTDQYDNSEEVSSGISYRLEDKTDQTNSEPSSDQVGYGEPSLTKNEIDVGEIASDSNPSTAISKEDKIADKARTIEQGTTITISDVVAKQQANAIDDEKSNMLEDLSLSFEKKDELQEASKTSLSDGTFSLNDSVDQEKGFKEAIAEEIEIDQPNDPFAATAFDASVFDVEEDPIDESGEEAAYGGNSEQLLVVGVGNDADVEITSNMVMGNDGESVAVDSDSSIEVASNTSKESEEAIATDEVEVPVQVSELKKSEVEVVSKEGSDALLEKNAGPCAEDVRDTIIEREDSDESQTATGATVVVKDQHDEALLRANEQSHPQLIPVETSDGATAQDESVEPHVVQSAKDVGEREDEVDNASPDLSHLGLDEEVENEGPEEANDAGFTLEIDAVEEEVGEGALKVIEKHSSVDAGQLEADNEATFETEAVAPVVIIIEKPNHIEEIENEVPVQEAVAERLEEELSEVKEESTLDSNNLEVSEALGSPSHAKKGKVEIVVPEFDYTALLQESLPEHLRLTAFQNELKQMEVVVEPAVKETTTVDAT